MRHFQLLQNVNVTGVMHELMRQPWMWGQNLREKHEGSPHAQAESIILRYQPPNGDPNASLDAVNYPEWDAFPSTLPIILDLMRWVGGLRLGRVVMTRLPPGGMILPHQDDPRHTCYYSRYQVMVQAGEETSFRAGNETASMRTGEVWWFDNSVVHDVMNGSHIGVPTDRIALIIDIHTIAQARSALYSTVEARS